MGAITPTPGVVYNFIFDAGYTAFNGVHKLVKLMTYDEFVQDGNDILQEFYTPNSKDENDLEQDLPQLRETKIMKLANPDEMGEEYTRYAPLMYLTETPDHNVKEYSRFGVVAFIGITDDVEHLGFTMETIKEVMSGAMGIMPDPQIITLGSQWLTDSQYAEELANRDETLKKTINYFTACKDLEKRLAVAQRLNDDYERIIIAMRKKLSGDSTTGPGYYADETYLTE